MLARLDAGAGRFIIMGLKLLVLGTPFPAAALDLFHDDVRQTFLPSAPTRPARIAFAAALLLPRRAAPEFPSQPPPAAFPEIRR